MAARSGPFGLALMYVIVSIATGGESATFTFINKCSYTVWPGILSNAGIPQPSSTGFALRSGESTASTFPSAWSGRMWGRTLCSQDPTTGRFSCLTGDCSSGAVECSGAGAIPPATLAEFTLDGAGGLDFYDVSLVDGYNLPMSVIPKNSRGGNCTVTGCAADLNGPCPVELKVSGGGQSVACKSACEAFGNPRYCCVGAYGTPGTCKPTAYSEFFKSACPRAYSFAYDDGTSTFTCASADYAVTFCPSPSTSLKTGDNQGPSAEDGSGSPIGTIIHDSAAHRTRSLPLVLTTLVVLGGHLAVATASLPSWLYPTLSCRISSVSTER